MNNNVICLEISIFNTVYRFWVLRISDKNDFINRIMLSYCNSLTQSMKRVFQSRYVKNYEDNDFRIEFKYCNMLSSEQNRHHLFNVKNSQVVLKLYDYFFSLFYEIKIDKSRKYFNYIQFRIHMLRDCKYMLRHYPGTEFVIIGKMAFEEFTNMQNYKWKEILDRKALSKHNLLIRNEAIGLDYLTNVPRSRYRDFNELLDIVQTIHICEINQHIMYTINEENLKIQKL
jgi:hypothetical protein